MRRDTDSAELALRLRAPALALPAGLIGAFAGIFIADADAAMLVGCETLETCAGRLGEPRRAMPVLARLEHRFPGTSTAAWARERLDELRREMRESMES